MKHKCGQGAFLESCDPAQQTTKSEEALVAFLIYMAGCQKYKRPGLQASILTLSRLVRTEPLHTED